MDFRIYVKYFQYVHKCTYIYHHKCVTCFASTRNTFSENQLSVFSRETHGDHLLIRLVGMRFFPLAGHDGRRTPRLYWTSCFPACLDSLFVFFTNIWQVNGIYGIIVCVEYLASVSNWCFLIYGACHVHCVFCFILLLWGAAAREKKKHVLTRAQRYRIPFWICFLTLQ